MNISRHIIFFLLTINYLCVQGQTSTIIPQDYYDFYNQFKEIGLKHTFYLKSEIGTLGFCFDTIAFFNDSAFTTADNYFIKQQIEHPVISNWGINKIKRATIIDSADLSRIFKTGTNGWSKFYEEYGTKGYYSLSAPYFSLKKDFCVIYISWYCGGLCGSGNIYICKREGNKWKILTIQNCWVS